MSKHLRGGVICATATLLILGLAPMAQARGGNGGSTSTGYSVSVQVVFSGDAAPGGGSTTSVGIPAACWWEPWNVAGGFGFPVADATDPQSVYEYYQAVSPAINGSFVMGRLVFPPEQVFLDAIEREATEDLTWYQARCRDSDDLVDLGFNRGVTQVPGGQIAVTFWPFPVAQGPPSPAVDPEDLAIAAREVMVIDEPMVDRNPKGAGALSAAAFVNLPTWFWVTDPETVGGVDGERTIRAEVVGSSVWAEVTALTGGLAVRSPAGSTGCEPAVAMTPWSAGASDSEGCTVSFGRASVSYPAGYPVSASTYWTATWEGQDQAGTTVEGDLDPLSRSVTVAVPVAEVQGLVTSTR